MAAPTAAPTNVLIQSGNGALLVSWDFSSAATSGYQVQRSTDQVSYSTVDTTPQGEPFYNDTTGTVGTQYWYRVALTNGDGAGPYSSIVTDVPTQPGQMTLGQLRLLSQQKADRVNSQFVTKTEWNMYINQSYFELYDLLVQKYGNDYFVAEPVEFVTTGANEYDLPNGTNYSAAKPFYKLMGVDLNIAAGNIAWLTLKKYEFISRNKYVYPQLTTNFLGVGSLQYRLVGGKLHFIPTPAAGQQIRMWYIPRLTTLLQDNDIADGVSGWLEYVAVDAAIKALQKEESDITALMVEKQALIARIEAAAENRDAGEPETISKTRNWGGWGNGDGGSGDIGPGGGY